MIDLFGVALSTVTPQELVSGPGFDFRSRSDITNETSCLGYGYIVYATLTNTVIRVYRLCKARQIGHVVLMNAGRYVASIAI